MLIKEKLEKTKFSNSEQVIVDFILDKKTEIEDYSIKEIAEQTFSSPSTLIRIAHKTGYDGWNDLKKDYLTETQYLQSHFQEIDANLPFKSNDTIQSIANKIGQLQKESIDDTLCLIKHDSLQKAVQLINKSKRVKIFCIANLNYVGEEFAFKMNRIHKDVYICPTQDNLFQDAAMTTPDECAICISYSGQTPTLLKCVDYLNQCHVPVIAITSYGNNQLSSISDTVLNISTREKSYSKIAGYSSLESISLILNILYSCYFSLNYDNNLEYKIKIAQQIETNRIIDNTIIEENDISF